MSRLGFKSLRVYHGDKFLGELELVPVKDSKDFQFPNNEIRISHISPPSERSPPLSVLQTISSFSIRCKLVSNLPPTDLPNPLITLHASCFYEHKTAVVVLGNEEIHLAAMPSKEKKFPCFWCCSVRTGLYNSCLAMLNLRCLAIVFDLDETLIVANTLKSFEDRIEALKGWISREADPIRLTGMNAELKRYSEDRYLLKQYADYDCVMDAGKMYKTQLEEVSPLSDIHDKFSRPVIRLPERNVVLTRINPEIRDTSVLVRLRPAWEDLRSYLTAKGRKRFEVFVCTMAERDYALEMWRLLDPESHLISTKQLMNRVVCVKSGAKKSLLNVFHDGICHPNLAMVIDDRLKVWEDKDQPRVHVVPAFTPYYAPQAETTYPIPVLCVARNVACNVRGGFFKEFDENLHRRICELFYEDDTLSLPPPPDVSNFLIVEDTSFAPLNGSTNPITEGITGTESEQRLQRADEKGSTDSAPNQQVTDPEPKPELAPIAMSSAPTTINPVVPRTAMASAKSSLLGVPVKRDGFTSESDVDKKRKLVMMKHGADARSPPSGDPPLLRLPGQVLSVPAQSSGGRLVEDDGNRGQLNNQVCRVSQEADVLKSDKQKALQSTSPLGQFSDLARGRVQEASSRQECQKPNLQPPNNPSGVGASEGGLSQNHVSSVNKERDPSKSNSLASNLSISVLQEIGRRCNSKVEFRSVVSTRHDLQFSIEVLFTGEKIGLGMGKTRKDAQLQAAENALKCLADKYLEYVGLTSAVADKDLNKLSTKKENGFIWDDNSNISNDLLAEESRPRESTYEGREVAVASSSSSMVSSPQEDSNQIRLQKSASNKQLKEVERVSQGMSSFRQQKNGNRPIL